MGFEAEREKDQVEVEERNEAAEALLELSRVEMSRSFSTMTEMSQSDLAQVQQAASERDTLMEDNVRLEENAALCKQIASLNEAIITPESLMDNDAKVKYYTGLPSITKF